ncbi:MAG: hypothetical protein CBB68_06910 [Rhodospirillaceae bacterium TMED8]|nr:MAG: hypothetical protein CBB68_06910 [Rhodospirillaceae bacterium TMED8]|tara:strand:+ start:104 stop:352 length:249 start_codon:yes stop_codon:yes gene_type:complete
MTHETQLSKIPSSFKITYYADKHQKFIERYGYWTKPNTDITGKCFLSSKGQICFIYWDKHAEPDANGNKWRMAKNPFRVEAI